jgi:hypothetical protein
LFQYSTESGAEQTENEKRTGKNEIRTGKSLSFFLDKDGCHNKRGESSVFVIYEQPHLIIHSARSLPGCPAKKKAG